MWARPRRRSTRDDRGDPCAGQPDTVTVGSNTWTVQQIYSLADDLATNGENYCVASKASPLPEQAGGPMAGVGRALSQQRPGHLDRLLPLPTVRIDENKKIEIPEREMRRYVNRITLPLRATEVPGLLPDLMRKAASHVETTREMIRSAAVNGHKRGDATAKTKDVTGRAGAPVA